MTIKEITHQAKACFGKDRKLLKKKILAFNFDGTEGKAWKKCIKKATQKPLSVKYLMFDDVMDYIKEGELDKIDWNWLGDVSWEVEVLLNEEVDKGYDWDKKLTKKCGGTARILRIFISDILPCYAFDVCYMTYSKEDNYYEFGPITNPTSGEQVKINSIKKLFKTKDYRLLTQKQALKTYKGLYSDLNKEGNASLFSVLFKDTSNYQTDIIRINDESLKDPVGKTIGWREYYTPEGKLEKRLEYRYYPSGNVQCTVTDNKGRITEVSVWRDIDNKSHQKFVLDVWKEYKRREKKGLKTLE